MRLSFRGGLKEKVCQCWFTRALSCWLSTVTKSRTVYTLLRLRAVYPPPRPLLLRILSTGNRLPIDISPPMAIFASCLLSLKSEDSCSKALSKTMGWDKGYNLPCHKKESSQAQKGSVFSMYDERQAAWLAALGCRCGSPSWGCWVT